MSSFYGNGSVISGSGSGGTSNYNDLSNIPIENLIGTESSPINLSELNYGNYVVKGSYKYNNENEIKKEGNPKNIQVFEDSVTKKKIVKFESIENGEYFIITLTYEEDGTFIEDKFSPQGSDSSVASELKLISF